MSRSWEHSPVSECVVSSRETADPLQEIYPMYDHWQHHHARRDGEGGTRVLRSLGLSVDRTPVKTRVDAVQPTALSRNLGDRGHFVHRLCVVLFRRNTVHNRHIRSDQVSLDGLYTHATAVHKGDKTRHVWTSVRNPDCRARSR